MSFVWNYRDSSVSFAWKGSMKPLNCSVKRNLERIKDQRENKREQA